jgi:carboxypeptidase Taq
VSARPPELAALRTRAAELADLHAVGALLFWDQNTMMPAGAASARAEHLATLERVAHERLTDPALGGLLAALEGWAAGEDPDADDVRLVHWLRRDFEKAVRVPGRLAAEMSHAAALGQSAWQAAREAGDFGRFRDALAHQLELRHAYAACFDGTGRYAHPYDVLLDDFEPGLATAELVPLFAGLQEALVPLVGAAAAPGEDPFRGGPFPVPAQRAAVREVLLAVGFDPARWRLDETVHPFAQGLSTADVRITTRWEERDLAMALYSVLHEFGHGLYESQMDPRLERTTLDEPVGLGVHESQSRLWENVVGRSRPFCGWVLPILREHLPGFAALDSDGLFRAANAVRPSLVRIEADETTYNLHIVLRFELELALMEGRLEVADLPAAWDEGMLRLLGVEVPGPVEGVLQDIHWSAGLIGYFPTYTLGNLIAAQLWERLREDVPDVAEQVAAGEFGAIRAWLREHVHRHGRRLAPRELLLRATGEELRTEPFLDYLTAKLRDAGVLAPDAIPPRA